MTLLDRARSWLGRFRPAAPPAASRALTAQPAAEASATGPGRRFVPGVEAAAPAAGEETVGVPMAATPTAHAPVVAPGPVASALVPRGLDVAAGYAWRVTLVGGAVYALFQVLAYFSTVTIPLAIAVLLAAMLAPVVGRLRAWGWHPIASAAVALGGMLLLIVGVMVGVGAQVQSETPELVDRTMAGITQLWDWLASGPLGIQRTQVDEWLDQLYQWVNSQRAMLAGMAASAGAQVGNFLAGTATALMATFFFCFQGRAITRSTVLALVPAASRPRAEAAALRGWGSLVGYMQAAVLVALVDAAGISLGAWLLGLPLVWALFALTFFAAFIPLVGAVTAGIVGVALALVTKGWVAALIMLAVIVLVQQLEGNVLQPVLLGQAAQLHPLAVLVGLIVGAVVAGIVGALLAIPLLAFASAFGRGLSDPALTDPPPPQTA